MFEDFRTRCWANYSYEIWDGQVFKKRINEIDKLVEQFFPSYNNYIKQREARLKNILK